MISKGTHIPQERLALAMVACAAASTAFEEWAGIGAGALPPDPIDSMQVQLVRWQRDRFGHVSHGDPVIALGVIEELGETFDDDASAEDAVDGLGDVMVYGAQLCTANRLAVRPVIGLALQYLRGSLPSPISIAGRFAHVVGKHEQRTRGLDVPEAFRLCLVDALAMVIAKALEDCALGHDLTIEPGGVFCVIGSEVIARKVGDTMIPAAPSDKAQRAQPIGATLEAGRLFIPLDGITGAQLDEQASLRGVDRQAHPQPLLVDMPPSHMMTHGLTRTMEQATELIVLTPHIERAKEQLLAGADLLAVAERLEPGDFDVSDEIAKAAASSVTPTK